MTPAVALDALAPHVWAVAIISARVLPVAFMCPLFGGPQAPSHLKLGVVLSLSVFLHVSCDIGLPPNADTAALIGAALKELVWGTALGLVSGLPFDLARMTGRYIDQFRGSQLEAAVAWGGGREAASGDVLYQLLLALTGVTLAGPMVLSALAKTFITVPLGLAHPGHVTVTTAIVTLVAATMASAMALAGPVAASVTLVDLFVGFAGRINSGLGLNELGTPLRLLLGASVLFLSLGLFGQALLSHVESTADAMARLAAAAMAQ